MMSPFDFTACGGYAQGERKKSSKKAPFVLSAAQRSRSTDEFALLTTH